ncbi:MAG: adenylosuccinate lyase [Candidatus Peregrinibacteria bacterium]
MQSLSPLDGRYRSQTEALRPYFSEAALFRARLYVEVEYLIALSDLPEVRALPKLSIKQRKALRLIIEKFTEKNAEEIRAIEKKTRHDVKAMEYFLKEKAGKIPGLKKHLEFIHFALTSEDVNNLAYGVLIQGALKEIIRPAIKEVIKDLLKLARQCKGKRMLSFTHGQPATPTTVEKEILVFVERLTYQYDLLIASQGMKGKFGGAVGNYSAHRAAYPEVAWEVFGRKFVKSLGFKSSLQYTTQINPHDDIAEISHLVFRIDTILINLCRDLWMYISRGVFKQKTVAGEVGSSTMPHKVNPIDFENAEGNLGLANALFDHFATKLPISRLQRDLSDSTVQRNIGVAFGYHLLAISSLRKGLGKISLDPAVLKSELAAHPEVRAEAIQTVLRKHGIAGAYEKLKALTRGAKVTDCDLDTFIDSLPIPAGEKKQLKS